MSLCMHGLKSHAKGGRIIVTVEESDPLIQLANLIDWQYLAELGKPDLKKTEKGFWWLGRKLNLRIHLAVMILQMLFKWTDRNTEIMIKGMPVYQIFCGLNIIPKWRCPDHTKIEKFRNRLSAKTHKKIGDYILQLAVKCGFGVPSKLDVDSTVQEANASYPSDAVLMKKLSVKCHKLVEYLQEAGKDYVTTAIEINIKAIIKKSQEYFFLAKNTCMEKKKRVETFDNIVGNAHSPNFDKSPLELSKCGDGDNRKRMEISFGCGLFYKNQQYQTRQTSIVQNGGCGLHSKRKVGKKLRIWQGVSVGQNYGEFSGLLHLYFPAHGRQRILDTGTPRASRNIREKHFGISGHGQGLLQQSECGSCKEVNQECGWHPTSGQCERSGQGPPQGGIIQSKGRSRINNRTRKTVWIRKEQNEIRRCHFGIGIPLGHGIQSSSANEKSGRSRGRLKKIAA